MRLFSCALFARIGKGRCSNGCVEEGFPQADRRHRGGGEGNTALKPLGLTDQEKQALRAFLVEGLTGPEIVVVSPQIP